MPIKGVRLALRSHLLQKVELTIGTDRSTSLIVTTFLRPTIGLTTNQAWIARSCSAIISAARSVARSRKTKLSSSLTLKGSAKLKVSRLLEKFRYLRSARALFVILLQGYLMNSVLARQALPRE